MPRRWLKFQELICSQIGQLKILLYFDWVLFVAPTMNVSNFDVFLCHNSEDKPQIRALAQQLRSLGISPWFDEWALRPGVLWQQVLEAQITQINSAAVFVGKNGLGPWQQHELEAFLGVFARGNKLLIPVLLPDAPYQPELPLFLQGRMWVDFRQNYPDPMSQLIWGITGNEPNNNQSFPMNSSYAPAPSDLNVLLENSINKLENLLSAQKIQEADVETKKIILQHNNGNQLTTLQIRLLPLDVLARVDQVWEQYSDGKFGLKIQQEIWLKSLKPEKPRFQIFPKKIEPPTESQAWNKFGFVVGWRGEDEKLLSDNKLTFSMKAPIGCFPRTRLWLNGGFANNVKQFVALMERVEQIE
jgi:hypothetical protein